MTIRHGEAARLYNLMWSFVLLDPITHNAFAYPGLFRDWLVTTEIIAAPPNVLVSTHA